MARTQARRKPSKPSTAKPAKSGRPLLTLCVGIGIGLLIPKAIDWVKSSDVVDQIQEQVAAEEDTATTPQFDFYTLLSDSEVIVPEVDAELRPGLELVEIESTADESETEATNQPAESPSTSSAPAANPANTTNEPATTYILQAGSFRSSDEAETVRVRLLLLNLPVAIQTVESQGDTWHRVIVGPYNSATAMSEARETLQSNSIESIVLKRAAN